MLGRALPLRDPETAEIIRWYGTATDIHDMVEAKTAEQFTREQLAEALTHAELTLWAVDKERKFTLLEGMAFRKSLRHHRSSLDNRWYHLANAG